MTNIGVIREDGDMTQSHQRGEYYEALKNAAINVLKGKNIDEKDLTLSKPFSITAVGETNSLEELEKVHDFISKLNMINIGGEVEEILKNHILPGTISKDDALEYIKNELENFIK